MHPLLRVVFMGFAFLGAAGVFAASMTFYQSSTLDPTSQKIFVLYALLSAFVKIAFPFAIISLAVTKGVRRLAWLAVVVCIGFDVLGVSGFLSMTRGAAVDAKSGEAVEYRELSAEVKRLRGRADEFVKVRPTATINVELKAAKAAAPDDCEAKSNSYKDSCKAFVRLSAEAANAAERDAREKAWAERKVKLDTTPRPNEAASNPLAAGLRKPLERIGVDDADFFIDLFLRILTIIISEVVPPLCSFFALHKAPAPEPVHKARTDTSGAKRPPGSRRPRAPPPDLLAAIRAVRAGTLARDGLAVSGAGVFVSNRALGAECGVSASKVNTGLRELAADGKVVLRPTPGGTYVELL